jgi:hypothetical protein
MLSWFLPALVTFTELVVVLRAYTSLYTAWPENLSRTEKPEKQKISKLSRLRLNLQQLFAGLALHQKLFSDHVAKRS